MGKTSGSYSRQIKIEGMDNQKIRKDIPWIHLVRVIACIMVVCLHVSTASREYYLTHSDKIFNRLAYLSTKPCVPLFFMVTGFLILPYKNGDDIKTFFLKRIPRVWFPLLFWGVVYAILPYLLGMDDFPTMLKELILSPIKMPDKIGGILWYLYILIGIYLFIPFMTERIYQDKHLLLIYLGIWMVTSIVMVAKPHVPGVLGENHYEHNFNMFIYFSGYMGYLLFGFAVRKYGDILFISRLKRGGKRKYFILLLTAFTACYVWGRLAHSFLDVGTLMMSACVFMLLRDVNIKDGWSYRLIKHISDMSLGIYLSHMFILKVITENIYKHVNASLYSQLLCMLLTFVCAYLLSRMLSRLPFKRYIIG